MYHQAEFLDLRRTGLTYAEIGRRYGISRERVRQVVRGEPAHEPKFPEAKTILKSGEVAQLLGVHINTIRRWSDKGTIKGYRLGARRDRRFHRQDIEGFLMAAGEAIGGTRGGNRNN